MFKIGIDEAGRGPWLGPVVACAFTFDYSNFQDQDLFNSINDSKKLNEKKRDSIYTQLINLSRGDNPSCFFGVGVVDNFQIDEINIKQANKEAMRRALVELLRKIPNDKIKSILIDGNDNYSFDELSFPPIFIIGGDSKVVEIGAASIIAKVFRDKLLITYSELYPDLGIDKHKGYGTKKHIEFLGNNVNNITGIHRLSYKPIKKILDYKDDLLLHVCCGPDSTIPILDLKDKYNITCYWYDPNIQPREEYDKRLDAFIKVCNKEKIKYIVGDYDVIDFMKSIKGYESTPEKGKKCEICYDMRLTKTVLLARKLGIRNWTTSLNISPHKCLDKIFKIGQKLDLKYKTNFLEIDFKKNNGFNRSVDYCKNNGIYRQDYCGCIYSDTFPEKYKNNIN